MNSQQPEAVAEPWKLILILLAGAVVYFMFFRKTKIDWTWLKVAVPFVIVVAVLLVVRTTFQRAALVSSETRLQVARQTLSSDTRPEREVEASEMNEKYIADIYPRPKDALASLASQLAARLLKDEELSQASFVVNKEAFLVHGTLYKHFYDHLNKSLEGSQITVSESKDALAQSSHDSNHSLVFDIDPGDEQQTMSLQFLTDDEPRYDVHATYAMDPGPWNDQRDWSLGFEYGTTDEWGCIHRASSALDMYLRTIIPNYNANRGRFSDDDWRDLEQRIMKRIAIDEFRQTYRQSIGGKELERPEMRVAMQFDLNQLEAVATEEANRFAQEKYLIGANGSTPSFAFAGPFNSAPTLGQLLFAPAGLAFIFFLTSSVARFFDTPRAQRNMQRQHESDAGLGLFLVYRSIAILVGCLTPIIFVSGGLGVMDRQEANLAGILCAILASMLWAGSGYARILFRAGPDESNRESVTQYHSATTGATILRCIGLVLVFACGMLFVVHGHEGDDELRFAAIACAILSAPAYTIAGMLDKAWADNGSSKERV